MRRITTGTRELNLFGPGKDGFKNGDLANAILPTDLNADWFNQMQEELANFIESAGIALDGAVRTQLVQALRSGALLHGVDTGTANARVVTYTPAIPALINGMRLWFQSAAANTGATTLNVNGLGVRPVLGLGQAALQGGEIAAGGRCQVVYSTALNSFVLVTSSGGSLQVPAATQSGHAANLAQLGVRGVTAIKTLGAGNFTVPAGVYALWVQVWGAGGGGGGSGTGGGTAGGGGGGGTAWKRVVVTPGQVLPYFIGEGGAGGGAGGAGTAGTASTFNGTVTAAPGLGAQVNPSGNGGSGGTATGGDVNMVGASGATGAAYNVQGGSGGGSPCGGGGGGGAQGVASGGGFPGGGGGGGGSGQPGGDGADGQIVITY